MANAPIPAAPLHPAHLRGLGPLNPRQFRRQRSVNDLRVELRRVKHAWHRYRSSRERDGVYLYLEAVFELVSKWKSRTKKAELFTRQLPLDTGKLGLAAEPFAAVITVTSDPGKVHKRTLSKWSRALQYATNSKAPAESLTAFLKKAGGLNRSASMLHQPKRRRS